MDRLPKPSASTQDHLDIEDIIDDLAILRTGWVALVMNTTAVNFDLLSEAEQDATIYAYGAFLNSLTFPIQLLIRSKKADISAYFHALAEAEKVQPNPDLKRQIQKYEDFIKSTVQQRTVLDKKFYIVVTYSAGETGFSLSGRKSGSAKIKGVVMEAAKASLFPRRDHVIKQLARLGLSARQLTSQELVELFYDIYNPAPTGTQRILLDSDSYKAPLVEPAIENPTPAKIEQEFGKNSALPNFGSSNSGGANSSPHAQVSVGQQDAVVEVGLRPVPPGGGLNAVKGDMLPPAPAGDSGGQNSNSDSNAPGGEKTQAQSDALSKLEKAVAEATKIAGNEKPEGLDLRDNASGDNSSDDNSGVRI